MHKRRIVALGALIAAGIVTQAYAGPDLRDRDVRAPGPGAPYDADIAQAQLRLADPSPPATPAQAAAGRNLMPQMDKREGP
jgi:hypothetical protein